MQDFSLVSLFSSLANLFFRQLCLEYEMNAGRIFQKTNLHLRFTPSCMQHYRGNRRSIPDIIVHHFYSFLELQL